MTVQYFIGSKPCFINICENELVDKPSSTREAHGVRWQIPHAVSPPRDELLAHPEPGGAKSVKKKRRSEKTDETAKGATGESSSGSSGREICRVFDASILFCFSYFRVAFKRFHFSNFHLHM